jgi:hypothetical protein
MQHVGEVKERYSEPQDDSHKTYHLGNKGISLLHVAEFACECETMMFVVMVYY